MTQNETAAVRRVQNAFVAIFFAALAIPAFTWDRRDDALESERRTRAPWPDRPRNRAELRAWPAGVEQYAQDRLRARDFAIRTYNRTLFFGLRTSPVGQVAMGKDGWLFFNAGFQPDTSEDPLADGRGTRPFTEQETDAFVRMLLERERLVASWGGRYLFIVAPNKSSIYPEYLPDSLAPVPGGDSPRRQLSRNMKPFPESPFLDLEPAMRRAKQEAMKRGETTYFRTDSHWNALGAMAALEEIARRIQMIHPDLRIPSTADFEEPGGYDLTGLDLARMLGMPDLFPDRAIVLKPRGEIPLSDVQRNLWIMVYRDSYFTALEPYWGRYFPRTLIRKIAEPFHEQDLLHKTPQLVIELVVERRLRSPGAL